MLRRTPKLERGKCCSESNCRTQFVSTVRVSESRTSVADKEIQSLGSHIKFCYFHSTSLFSQCVSRINKSMCFQQALSAIAF